VSSTLWRNINFQGVSQGNVCKIENISSVRNIDELKFDIWQKFNRYFLPRFEQFATTTNAIVNDLAITNPDLSVIEGGLRLVTHMIKERNHDIVKIKKELAIKNNSLICEVCTFSFPKTYNNDFIECHHLVPIGTPGVRETRLQDLGLVCANCHRMLHIKFDGKYLSIEQLRVRMHNLITS
jgi:predicted HNH restriction endonuclease